jgi:hypothetical protein
MNLKIIGQNWAPPDSLDIVISIAVPLPVNILSIAAVLQTSAASRWEGFSVMSMVKKQNYIFIADKNPMELHGLLQR